MKFLLIVLLLIPAVPAFAGEDQGWESSGGEIFRFRRNPWFVKNTPIVNYCIQHEANSMSADLATVRRAIRKAIDYWKFEFNSQQPVDLGQGFVAIATQNFVEVECPASPPVIFKFGHGTLTEEEVEYLKDPRKFVGVSVRKNFDKVNLKGDGFIFIASDLGPNSYRRANNMIERAWQHEKLLQYALMHELGHLFGIPHTGVGLMSEVFLDQLLNRRFSRIFLDKPIERFIQPPPVMEVCSNVITNGRFLHRYFNVDASAKCLRLRLTQVSEEWIWAVESKMTSDSPWVEAGEIKASPSMNQSMGLKPSLIVQLPAEQTVFTSREIGFNSYGVGPPIMQFGAQGFFRRPGSRRPYSLFINLSTTKAEIVARGTANREEVVFEYVQPTLLNILVPIVTE